MHLHYTQQCQATVDQILEIYKNSPRTSVLAVFGPCYSGKTTTAIWLARALHSQGLRVRVAQPAVERPTDIFDGYIETRDGDRHPALSYHNQESLQNIFEAADVVIFNEIQFSPENIQNFLIETIEDNVRKGIWVISAGLFYSSMLTVFPIAQRVADLSLKIFELVAICESCGEPNAIYSQRLIHGKPASLNTGLLQAVSDDVRYAPRCAGCHQINQQ